MGDLHVDMSNLERTEGGISSGNSNLAEEEEALEGWPGRLLHVPSLTAFEWQPGNCYGGIRNPTCNAISYTWRRWKLNDTGDFPESLEVFALPAQGCPWTLPRLDPAHFTAEESHQVIRAATTLQPWDMMVIRKNDN